MRSWLTPLLACLQRGEAAALVHVVMLEGSGPRESGAQMLVTASASHGTIGGGQLEYTAIAKAREWLERGRAGLIDLKLGPELSQCCGGAVTLAVEPFAPADLAWVRKLAVAAGEPLMRTVHLDGAGRLRRAWAHGGGSEDFTVERIESGISIREQMNLPDPELWLFGAGHVGRAVICALAPLGFAITWVDGRAGQFPDQRPAGIRTLELAMPELIVDEGSPGASYLVMTHSHSLDEAICEAILRRGDFAYLGLIGSKTKRARFRQRLRRAGVPPAALDRLTCPIGLPGIKGKDPAVIAASVAADLLIRREKAALRTTDDVFHDP